MKHVFVIHSNTVLLSALGTIEVENIEKKNVIFLYGRNFTSSLIDMKIKTFDISELYGCKEEYGIWGRKFRLRKYAKKIDRFVEDFISSDYEVYVPHTGSRVFQALITNKYCIATNWLQEGAYSFFFKSLADPARVRRYNLFFSSSRFWYQENWGFSKKMAKIIKPHNAYALSESLFEPLKVHNVMVKRIFWPKIEGKVMSLPRGSNVFLFESAIELGLIEKKVYMDGCRELIKASGVTECYVKFHPNQTQENIQEIISMFDGISYKYCPNDYPFELIMSSSDNLSLYGFTTSLLKFGEDMGHVVFRKDEFLRQRSHRFSEYCQSLIDL